MGGGSRTRRWYIETIDGRVTFIDELRGGKEPDGIQTEGEIHTGDSTQSSGEWNESERASVEVYRWHGHGDLIEHPYNGHLHWFNPAEKHIHEG